MRDSKTWKTEIPQAPQEEGESFHPVLLKKLGDVWPAQLRIWNNGNYSIKATPTKLYNPQLVGAYDTGVTKEWFEERGYAVLIQQEPTEFWSIENMRAYAAYINLRQGRDLTATEEIEAAQFQPVTL